LAKGMNRFGLKHAQLLLWLFLVVLGLLSCRQTIPSPPAMVKGPRPAVIPQIPQEPSEEERALAAPTVLDLPPIIAVLPPLIIKEKKFPPPEPWKIVVKKNQRKLFLYQQGELLKTYPVDLGKSPKGPKICQGDMRTPEGEYKIIAKKDQGQTNFSQALLLNYPNELDRRRYELAVENGLLPRETGIGGMIEIHGEGIGFDWTKGCIALLNPYMKELFNQVPVGTTVEIDP
jgi:lipoprotein-anchoring transpeptidase ErfK/SrfK